MTQRRHEAQLERLFDHRFAKQVFESITNSAPGRQADTKPPRLSASEQATLRQLRKYRSDVFGSLVSVIVIVQRILHSHALIGTFPRRAHLERRGIAQADWIAYHHNQHCLGIVSLYDATLILTSTVHRLGLQPQDCRSITILKNQWIADTEIERQLRSLEKLADRQIQFRHKYVHRGENVPIPELGYLSTMDLLKRSDPALFPDVDIRTEYQKARRVLLARLQTELDDTIAVLDSALTQLGGTYALISLESQVLKRPWSAGGLGVPTKRSKSRKRAAS